MNFAADILYVVQTCLSIISHVICLKSFMSLNRQMIGSLDILILVRIFGHRKPLLHHAKNRRSACTSFEFDIKNKSRLFKGVLSEYLFLRKK